MTERPATALGKRSPAVLASVEIGESRRASSRPQMRGQYHHRCSGVRLCLRSDDLAEDSDFRRVRRDIVDGVHAWNAGIPVAKTGRPILPSLSH